MIITHPPVAFPRSIFFVVILLLFGTSFAQLRAKDKQPFPGEPNDTIKTAQQIEIGKEVKIALTPRHDVDWLAIKAPADGVATVKLLENKVHKKLYIYWLDNRTKRTFRGHEWDCAAKKDETVYFAFRSADWGDGEIASLAPVKFKVRFDKQPFPGEPNDSVKTAQKVEFDKDVTFALTPRHDVDWFTVKAPADGVATVTVLENKAHKHLYLFWLDNASQRPFRGHKRDCRAKKGETLYFAFRSADWGGGEIASLTPVRFKIQFNDQPFPGEPNDTVKQAQAVEFGKEVKFALTPRHDVDWFSVKAPGDGVATVTVLENKGHKRLYLYWLNNASQRPFRGHKRDCRAKKGETLYFAFRSADWGDGETASLTPVRFKVHFDEQPFPGEPNDTIKTAQQIEIGKEVKIALTPRHDVDWLAVKAPADGVATVTVLENKAHKHLYLFWLNNATQHLFRGHQRDCRAKKGETLYFAFRSADWGDGETASLTPVRFKVHFDEQPFPGEPNDSVQTAQQIEIGKEVKIALTPRHDVDWLTFKSPSDGSATVTILENKAHKRLYIFWLDEKTKRPFRGHQLDCRVQKGKLAYLGIRSADWGDGEVASLSPIRLRVDVVNQPFPGEPNDTIQTAQKIELGKEVKIAFTPRHDVDWLRFTAPGDGFATVSIVENKAHKNLYVFWWDPKQETIVRGHERDMRVSKGDVFVGLRSADWADNELVSVKPVRLRVDFTKEKFPGEPNDLRTRAQKIELGKDVAISLQPRRDVDWFQFVSPGDGAAIISILENKAHPQLFVFWWNEKDKKTYRHHIKDRRVRKGETVYFGIRSADSGAGERAAPDPVKFKVDFKGGVIPGARRKWVFAIEKEAAKGRTE